MTPHGADAARNAHPDQHIQKTTTGQEPHTRTTTTSSTRTMNDTNTSTSTIHQQIKDQSKEGRNHEQSTNRAGIPMPPARTLRDTCPSRTRQIDRAGSACAAAVGVRDAA